MWKILVGTEESSLWMSCFEQSFDRYLYDTDSLGTAEVRIIRIAICKWNYSKCMFGRDFKIAKITFVKFKINPKGIFDC